MKSLNTNTLLRLLLTDIPEQTSKIEKLLSDTSQKFFVADLVFAEIVWVLQGKNYKYDKERIVMNLESIIGIKHIVCNKEMLEKAMLLYLSNSKISFTDSCLVSYAELNNNVPLLTFDRKLSLAVPSVVTKL